MSPSRLTLTATDIQEGKDKKGKKDAPAAAGVDVVSVDELNQKIATLEKEKNKEEEYRNYMQLERVMTSGITLLLHCIHSNPTKKNYSWYMSGSRCIAVNKGKTRHVRAYPDVVLEQ